MPSFSLFSRRHFVRLLGTTTAGLTLARIPPALAVSPQPSTGVTYEPDEILRELLAGNEHFIRGELTHPRRRSEDFKSLTEGQRPQAVIVGCADSRVAPEIVFDQGVGDLFVIRVAGNVVGGAGPIVKGSIEYAVAELTVPLVMVLGHSQCGAVKAAIKLLHDNEPLPGSLNDLVSTIKPAVMKARGRPGDLLDNAIRANVEMSVERLQTLEPILASPIQQGQVKVVGAMYDLRSGRVTVIA